MGRRTSGTAVLASLMILTGCVGNRAPLRIGVNPWPPCELWYVAEKQGYFGSLPVQIVRFSTWSDNMASLYSGKVDVTHASYFNALYYSDKGEKGQIILVSDTLLGGDGLAVKNTVGSIIALKGKRVAVEINTDEHFLLNKALESFRLSEEDVVIVPCTSAEARDFFVAGKVDACFTYEPFLTDAAVSGNGTVIWTTRDKPDYMMDVLVGREEKVSKRSKDFVVLLNAWYRAQTYIKGHEQEAFPLLGAKEQMGAEDFGAFYKSFTFFSASENKDILRSAAFREKLREMNEFLAEHKSIGAKADIDAIATTRIIDGIK